MAGARYMVVTGEGKVAYGPASEARCMAWAGRAMRERGGAYFVEPLSNALISATAKLKASKMALTKYEKSRMDTIEMRHRVLADFLPLFDHMIKLADDSYKHGYAARAGRELLHARRLLKHGERG